MRFYYIKVEDSKARKGNQAAKKRWNGKVEEEARERQHVCLNDDQSNLFSSSSFSV